MAPVMNLSKTSTGPRSLVGQGRLFLFLRTLSWAIWVHKYPSFYWTVGKIHFPKSLSCVEQFQSRAEKGSSL